jgi:predicted nucleotidyltransferase
MVLELPCAFSVRDAENFALGAVSIFSRLGFVTHMSFGTEALDPAALIRAAELLENPNEAFQAALRASLAKGRPLPPRRRTGSPRPSWIRSRPPSFPSRTISSPSAISVP